MIMKPSDNYIIKITSKDRVEVVPIDIKNELRCLQELVGGWIETYTDADGFVYIFNEEGRINDLPFNKYATLATGIDEGLFGDVLICRFDGEDGFKYFDCAKVKALAQSIRVAPEDWRTIYNIWRNIK